MTLSPASSPSSAGSGIGSVAPERRSASPPQHTHARRKQNHAQEDRRARTKSEGAVQGMMSEATWMQNVQPVASSKGTWMPAAIFIFLSHILVGWYFIGFTWHALFGTAQEGTIYRVSSTMIVLTFVAAWLNLLGITAGYHRLWSHRSYTASTGLRIFLAIIGLCSFQGSARWWVLKHRLHHRFTDTASDPYDSRKGLWYSHIGWLFEAPPYIEKVNLISMKDVDGDPVAAFQKRYLLLGYVIFGLLIPGLIGIWTDSSFVIGALWIGFIGRFLSWHCIWTINSLSHWHGIKEFSRASSAVYVALVNLVQNGEGHHNYHHCFPKDYRHGHRWYEWDPTKWSINLWFQLGLATELQTIDQNEVLQAQAQVKQSEADELSSKVRWPKPLDQLPIMTQEEFRELAEKTKGTKVLLQWKSLVLDVTDFRSHPGGFSYLQAYHGRDITAAFGGGINLHSEAGHNLAEQHRIAVIREDQSPTSHS